MNADELNTEEIYEELRKFQQSLRDRGFTLTRYEYDADGNIDEATIELEYDLNVRIVKKKRSA